ncbi:S66 peptidase family protein [Paenibacillus eucommiae]|uniref:Muramoyltetrapeptide carboxypeptidase n=1 Tax=Paenibacillus eucommiae TaxID=1355755 RepID=A0ABS4INM7_9BACL|nr:LD-carboxypeptidase [Paenibacillus eucommiae]MBP1989167.1 muramoyltetrapeptide carboxypeptidase [Paenibacillus eucommiae]
MPTYPRILRRGDTIGIVTLGSPLPAPTINNGIAFLQKLGFKVVLGKYVYDEDGFLAATAAERASDLMNMFTDPNVRMILPTRGGVGVAGILPYLDYQVIAKNPKILSGYSDISVLMNVLYQRSRLVTFSSLLLIDFRADTPAYNFNQFFEATSTIHAPRPITNPPGTLLISKVPGDVTGPVVGGNLTSIIDTLGTPFEIDTKGNILFLEETHEHINKVYRMLNHLKLAGKFNDCIGIVMGQCTLCQTSYGKTYDDLIDEFIIPLGKPLITNLSAAHGMYKAAVPIGASINLDASNNLITVLEPTVTVD